MTSTLPLKIRAGIRDLYDPENSLVKTALRSLTTECGCSYTLDINWYELREEIAANVLDNDVLVPNIVDAITIFLNRLISLIHTEDDVNNNAGATEEILHLFLSKTRNSRIISIKAHPVTDGAVTFTRFTQDGKIQLYLPRVRGGYAPNSSFGHDILETLLSGISSADPISSIPSAIEEPTSPEFVDVGGTRTWAHKIVFPEVSQIPRPENLLQQAPLFLRLKEGSAVGGDNSFELEGHQRSVDLIYDYLKLHSQNSSFGNHQLVLDRRKMSWGTGLNTIFVKDNRSDFLRNSLALCNNPPEQLEDNATTASLEIDLEDYLISATSAIQLQTE